MSDCVAVCARTGVAPIPLAWNAGLPPHLRLPVSLTAMQAAAESPWMHWWEGCWFEMWSWLGSHASWAAWGLLAWLRRLCRCWLHDESGPVVVGAGARAQTWGCGWCCCAGCGSIPRSSAGWTSRLSSNRLQPSPVGAVKHFNIAQWRAILNGVSGLLDSLAALEVRGLVTAGACGLWSECIWEGWRR
jgi:hypothetical protein